MQGLMIDWLTFSLKPDKVSDNRRDVDLSLIRDFLNLNSEFINFVSRGGLNGYSSRYEYNGVQILIPSDENYEQMGYCVSMSGSGFRYYAGLFRDFKISDFFKRLRALPETGLSLNISRIDLAFDDKPQDGKSGKLNLDIIIKKAELGEYISTSRTKQTIREIIQYKGDNISGRTIYFGSRKSSSYIRIYDKAAEQGVAGHWIRVEFEFKQETAMRIVNAICETGEKFPAYFAKVSNHYLRFIEIDDINRSRCSVSGFWSDFLGTIERASLAILPFIKKTLSKLFSHIIHSYAPSFYVLNEVFPVEFINDILKRNGKSRLKQKHYEMIDNPDIFQTPFSNSEKWDYNVPVSVYGQLSLA